MTTGDGRPPVNSVLSDLGLRPVINVAGSVSRLGGTALAPEVVEAMAAASHAFVPLVELQAVASATIADATGAEAGCVASGAAACLFLAAAACLARLDPAVMDRLPDTTGIPNEIVVHRAHRNPYDHAIRAAGARFVAIATSLYPKVIVADEPTSALDVVVQRQVMQTLGRLQEGLGAAVVLIGHDMGLIAQFADIVGVMYAGRLVEVGPVGDVISAPRHPYTRLLIDSLPSLNVKKDLAGIPGLPPALLNLPPGCSFNPRCPYAFERCRIETPDLQDVAPLRQAACHLYPEHAVLPPLPPSVEESAMGASTAVEQPVAGA